MPWVEILPVRSGISEQKGIGRAGGGKEGGKGTEEEEVVEKGRGGRGRDAGVGVLVGEDAGLVCCAALGEGEELDGWVC